MALGPALIATKSFSHPDFGRTYERAWEICQQLGDHPREVTALRGLMLHHLNLQEMEKSQHFAEEALRVAARLGDGARLVGAHIAPRCMRRSPPSVPIGLTGRQGRAS
jgi:hypothetical protein